MGKARAFHCGGSVPYVRSTRIRTAGTPLSCAAPQAEHGFATRDTRHATRDTRRATCDVRRATCDMRHATCDMRHATCDMRRATCDVRHATSDERRATSRTVSRDTMVPESHSANDTASFSLLPSREKVPEGRKRGRTTRSRRVPGHDAQPTRTAPAAGAGPSPLPSPRKRGEGDNTYLLAMLAHDVYLYISCTFIALNTNTRTLHFFSPHPAGRRCPKGG